MNSSFSAGRKIFLLKPVREGKAAARIQELHRRREEVSADHDVRNGLDGPKHIKCLFKLHVFPSQSAKNWHQRSSRLLLP